MSTPGTKLLSPVAIAAGIVALAPVALAGGFHHKETRELTAPHVEASPIHVEARNGSISIAAYDGEQVRVSARLMSKSERRLEEAVVVVERVGETRTLTIRCEWPRGKHNGNDACSFEILVPDAHGVVAETSNGSISITDLSGALTADTSNGSINVTKHEGPVAADTSNGSIVLTGILGAVSADTSNGSIVLEGVGGSVSADTSNGSISVVLTDDNPGPVALDTHHGSITLEVGAAFAGTVEADTGMGRFHVGPFPEGMSVEIVSKKKTEGTVVFGGKKSPRSVVDTSFGSVIVRGRS